MQPSKPSNPSRNRLISALARPRTIVALRLAALPAASALVASTAAAFIVGVAGMAVMIAPPASVKPGDLVDDDIHAFNEQQNVILPVDITVDAAPGTALEEPSDINPFVIPRGTCVKSHYIHYEPEATTVATGGVAFDSPILGVALLQSSLDATNFLGALPPTDYPVAPQCVGAGVDCGIELPGDRVLINPQNVQVEFLALSPGDRIRVITRGNPDACRPICHAQDC